MGLKNGKKAKLSKTDDNDIIGGLLDGLDLDFESEMENISDTADEHISEEDEEDDEYFSDDVDDSEKMKENPYVAPGLEETKSSEKLGLAHKDIFHQHCGKNGFRSWRKCLRGNPQIKEIY